MKAAGVCHLMFKSQWLVVWLLPFYVEIFSDSHLKVVIASDSTFMLNSLVTVDW